MREFVIGILISYIKDYLTQEKMREFAEGTKAYLVPKLHEWRDTLLIAARREAAKSETTIDDAAVDALEAYIDAFMPDNEIILK